MRRRKRHARHANHERWLVSYADFITLLFAFFVVLYASSQVDKKKVGMLAYAIQSAFQQMGVFQTSGSKILNDGANPLPADIARAIQKTDSAPEGPPATDPKSSDALTLQSELQTLLAPEIERKEIAMRREPDGLVISLREAGFFESGSAQMKSNSQAAFDRIANMLRQHNYCLRIEGHTDNVPIRTTQFPSNWELSASRATEIVRLLVVRDGFAPDHLSAGGFAEFHPTASNRTAEGRSMNRRVDIVILGSAITAPMAQAGMAVHAATSPAVAAPKIDTEQP